jgi:MYXO-CTERM domain-containing protein
MGNTRGVVLRLVSTGLALTAGCTPDGAGLLAPDEVETVGREVVGGEAAGTCVWPNCLFGRGCSATLVHPRLTTTAAHCVRDNQMDGVANVGEAAPFARTVPRELCRRPPQYTTAGQTGAYDIAFCTLREPIDNVPIVPVLSACEAEQMIKPGKSIVIAGFGAPNSGRKFSGRMTITSVRNGAEVFLRGDGITAGRGDSGGPGYLQMPDGTWRTFGVASRASGRNVAIYTLISAHLPWLEKESGIDLTPCHGASGGWEDGPACDRFPTDPGGTANGTWADFCQASPVAKPMPSCSADWHPGDGGPVIPPRPDGGDGPRAEGGAAPAPDAGQPEATPPPPPPAPPAPPVPPGPSEPPTDPPPSSTPMPIAPPIVPGPPSPAGAAPPAGGAPPATVNTDVPADGGCGCDVGGRPRASGAAWFLLLAGLAVRRQRRRG